MMRVLTDQRGWTVCKNSWALQCHITNRGARIDRAERSATHAGDPKLPDLGNSSGGSYETPNDICPLIACLATLTIAACGSDTPDTVDDAENIDVGDVTLTLVTHDSFAITEGVFESFRDSTGITVEVLTSGDVGSLVSQTILSEGNPVGDVIFGVDNTFMQRFWTVCVGCLRIARTDPRC